MPLFEWEEKYSVSVQRFDDEHKKLFALLNELNDAMTKRRATPLVGSTLDELKKYCELHFTAEEGAMLRAGFPGLQAHAAEHRAFTQTVAQHCAEYASNKHYLPIDLLFLMHTWLVNHIDGTDRKYSEFLNRAGYR